jgi:cytidine deaminase
LNKNSITDKLIETALKTTENSYSPHSKFKVGAALVTDRGNIFKGVNVEFDAYTLTVCAERAALFNAISNGERKPIQIAIATNSHEFKYPCGLCRQALAEFNPELEIILVNKSKKIKKLVLKKLIPDLFKLK